MSEEIESCLFNPRRTWPWCCPPGECRIVLEKIRRRIQTVSDQELVRIVKSEPSLKDFLE